MKDTNSFVKIDIVYTWVDGNDKHLAEIKRNLQKKLNIYTVATDECRFYNNDELKYSLRSLEKYANWINNIYIVTNNQCPEWLNTNNHRIHIINHADIMPENSLPCFNSNAIEHCLINIPNLSEFFLYANDDYFFADFVTPEFFFKKSKPIYRYNGRYARNDDFYNAFLMNSEQLIYNKFKKRYDRYPHHNIDPYVKSQMKKCYETFKNEIDKTIFSQFRQKTDIQRSIYASYALATNEGIYKVITDKNSPLYKRIWKFLHKKFPKDSIYASTSNTQIISVLKQYKPKLFCVNDTEKTTIEERNCTKKKS